MTMSAEECELAAKRLNISNPVVKQVNHQLAFGCQFNYRLDPEKALVFNRISPNVSAMHNFVLLCACPFPNPKNESELASTSVPPQSLAAKWEGVDPGYR